MIDKLKPRERVLCQLRERWEHHKDVFYQLKWDVEMLAVGMLLEMPGNKFVPGKGEAEKSIELLSLRKDPRILVKYANAEVYFDDMDLEWKEEIVKRMWDKLNKRRQA